MTGDLASSAEPEWKLLLACCSPNCGAISRERVRANVLAVLDWAHLLALAENHGVIPLLARCLSAHCADLVPPTWRDHLRECGRTHVFRALSLTAEFFRLMDLLEHAGIETALFKGPVLGVQAFGDAGLRQYSDLDVFVRHGDALRACRLLLADGYETRLPLREVEAGKVPGQFLFTRQGSTAPVELHTERTMRYIPKPLLVDAMLDRRMSVQLDGRDVRTFSLEDTLVLISIHGSKHLWDRLMWIADVAALARNERLDPSAVLRFAGELGAARMVRLGVCLAQDLLDATLPEGLARDAGDDPVAQSLARYVARRLRAGEQSEPDVFERAWFRTRMRGSLVVGLPYLLRLAFAPTEDDWGAAETSGRSRIFSVLRRPFRLLRKYGVERR